MSERAPLGAATVKGFTRGTHRVLDPADFWPRIKPLLPCAGVTRLANITGLDYVGIPVVSAMRPTGLTLSVASGKGISLEAAMVSAAMEAIEVFCAETAKLPAVTRSSAELTRSEATVSLHDLPLRKHALTHEQLPTRWTFGLDLLNGVQTLVPVDLVTLATPSELTSPFHQTSNGLASGAAYIEAVLAALLEVAERDAVGCWQLAATLSRRPLPRVRIETLNGMPLVQELLGRLAAANVEPIVYDCMVDTRIPAYLVRLVDRSRRYVGVFSGSGAHLDPEVALLRALTEAAQSRAVYAAGSRDDLLGRELAQVQAQDSPAVIRVLVTQPSTIDASHAVSMAAPTLEADVARIIALLAAAGIEQVIVVDLTPAAFRVELSVVRAVVPGLAGPGVERGFPSRRAQTLSRRLAA